MSLSLLQEPGSILESGGLDSRAAGGLEALTVKDSRAKHTLLTYLSQELPSHCSCGLGHYPPTLGPA